MGASISRYPLEGYREKCETTVTIGGLHAENPIELDIPITIAGMSFGALSGPAKEALGRGASAAGTSTTTGDGGMTPEERGHSDKLVYQYLPSRYGMNPDDLRKADAIEIVVGQGAKPGGGGMLLGQKISDRVAEMRNLPKGIDQRSACRHPDWTGPDDLEIKILELREITGWKVPIYVKVAGARPYYDTTLADQSGCGCGRFGRHAGRYSRHARRVHRARGPANSGDCTPRGSGAAGPRHAPQGSVDPVGRHSVGRRCGQGDGLGRGCGCNRHSGVDRTGRQRPQVGSRIQRAWAQLRAHMMIGTKAETRRHHDARP